MRLICISDTHSRHGEMPPLPKGDVLIHAGDCTASGTLGQLEEFLLWFSAHPHQNKILIAGNHDNAFADCECEARSLCRQAGVIYLSGETVKLNEIYFYGFPWHPIHFHMAFEASESEIEDRLKLVPDETNVLITHGPALQVFDYIPDQRQHVGSHALAERIDQLPNLKAHICGHIHESHGFGIREIDRVKFANAAICDERYRPVNAAIIIDL